MASTHFNTTTKRLEGYARRLGIDASVAKTPGNAGGAYHLVAENGRPLPRWVSLGWTVTEARESLARYLVEAQS